MIELLGICLWVYIVSFTIPKYNIYCSVPMLLITSVFLIFKIDEEDFYCEYCKDY